MKELQRLFHLFTHTVLALVLVRILVAVTTAYPDLVTELSTEAVGYAVFLQASLALVILYLKVRHRRRG